MAYDIAATRLTQTISLQFQFAEREVASLAAFISQTGVPGPRQFSEMQTQATGHSELTYLRGVGFAPIYRRGAKFQAQDFYDRYRSEFDSLEYGPLQISENEYGEFPGIGAAQSRAQRQPGDA